MALFDLITALYTEKYGELGGDGGGWLRRKTKILLIYIRAHNRCPPTYRLFPKFVPINFFKLSPFGVNARH